MGDGAEDQLALLGELRTAKRKVQAGNGVKDDAAPRCGPAAPSANGLSFGDMARPDIIAETRNPEGHLVQLDQAAWDHVLEQHIEMGDHLAETLTTISTPDHREPDVRPGRRTLLPPRRPAALASRRHRARGRRRSSRHGVCAVERSAVGRLAEMTVHVGQYEFDHVSYDRDGDVLHLRRGERRTAADTFGTPEGHALQIDEQGDVIGMTIVNAKWLLDRDGKLTITVPNLIETNVADLTAALAAA